MKAKKSNLIQISVLAALGLAAVLSLVLPQLLRGEREPQLLSLSVMLRDTDSSGWTIARQGMEQAAYELGAELRFLTLTEPNDSAEQEALLLREIDGGAAALIVVPADPEALRLALDQWLVVCPTVTLESPMEGAAGTVSPDNPLLGQRLAETLLEEDRPKVRTSGSGIGVRNVHQRIALTFGAGYGLTILSEPDEGTLVRLRLPALSREEAEHLQQGEEL